MHRKSKIMPRKSGSGGVVGLAPAIPRTKVEYFLLWGAWLSPSHSQETLDEMQRTCRGAVAKDIFNN